MQTKTPARAPRAPGWSAASSGWTRRWTRWSRADARPEVLAQGYKWSEGPVWTGGALLFSDVPNNVDLALARDARASASSCARAATPAASRAAASPARTAWPSTPPAACTCASTAIGASRAWRRDGKTFETVADRFDGKRFNSPNDLVVRANGDVYFTDPIYGLVGPREGSGARDPVERRLPRRAPAAASTCSTRR